MSRTVKWTISDDGNTAYGKHFHGDYVITICDMDGDATEWEVWDRKDYESHAAITRYNDQFDDYTKHKPYPNALAEGRVIYGDDFEIGKAIAIEAMDAIIRYRASIKEAQ